MINKIVKWLVALIIIVLLALSINQNFTGGESTSTTDTVTVIDTVHDTTIIAQRPRRPEKIHDTIFIPADIDSLEVVKAYYAKYFLEDTVANDSTLFVSIRDTITQNEVISRTATIIKHFPYTTTTVINTVTKEVYNNGFYGGVYVGQSYGANVYYQRNKYIFNVSAGTKGVTIGGAMKLGK